MTWLANSAFEESDRFVGREDELRQWRMWLKDLAPATQLWNVHGIAGMGKSTLLWQWMAAAHREQIPSIWMDGRSCPKQPIQFLDYLFEMTGKLFPLSPRNPRAWPGRFLWVIDNFDDLELLEGWLREDLIGRLPEVGGLLVVASRRGLSPHWLVHPIWAPRITNVSLGPWAQNEVRSYCRQLGLPATDELEQMLRPLQGHPLSLAVAGEYLMRRGTVMSQRDYSFLEPLTAELLREVTDPGLRSFVDVLTVLPVARQDMIARIAAPLIISAAQYRDLSHLSFVRVAPGGIALHDVVRSQLLAYMQEHNPVSLKRLRLKALDSLGTLYRQSEGPERHHLAYLLLEITAQSLPLSSPYANIAAVDEIVRENQLKSGDLEVLHHLLDEWGRQSLNMPSSAVAHAFLNGIVARFDGDIRVFREPSGDPVAFFATLPLYRQTVQFVEHYVPGSIDKYFPDEKVFPSERQEADTYFGTLVGVSQNHPRYQSRDLLGILIRDGLSFLGRGLRGVIGVSEPNLKRLLQILGFVSHPVDEGGDVEAFTLDMRDRDFLLWVGSIMRALNRPFRANSYAVDETRLRNVLKVIQDPLAFRQSGIAEILGCQAEEARDLLYGLLTKDPVSPISPAEQQVLRLTFIERVGNADSVALALHLSRPTYYRMLKKGLGNLCKVLESGDFLSIAME